MNAEVTVVLIGIDRRRGRGKRKVEKGQLQFRTFDHNLLSPPIYALNLVFPIMRTDDNGR